MISACAPRALSEASASFFGASRQDCALMPAFELALPSERQQEQNASMSAMREELHQLAIAERLRLTEIATLDQRRSSSFPVQTLPDQRNDVPRTRTQVS